MPRKTRYTYPEHELTAVVYPDLRYKKPNMRCLHEPDFAVRLLADFKACRLEETGDELKRAKAVDYLKLAVRFNEKSLPDMAMHAVYASRLLCGGSEEFSSMLTPTLRQDYADYFNRVCRIDGRGRARKTATAHRQGIIVLSTQHQGFIRVDENPSPMAQDLFPCRIP